MSLVVVNECLKKNEQGYSEFCLLLTSSLSKLKSMQSKLGNGGYVPIKIEQCHNYVWTATSFVDDPSLFWPILCDNTYDTLKILNSGNLKLYIYCRFLIFHE